MDLTRRGMLGATLGAGVAVGAPALAKAAPAKVERWGVWELPLQGPASGNPFTDIKLTGWFDSGGREVRVPGFYDGDGVYRIRFSPPDLGRWTWRTESNAVQLSGHSGHFDAVAPHAGNRGPVRVTGDGFHFAYADGTPFRQVGPPLMPGHYNRTPNVRRRSRR